MKNLINTLGLFSGGGGLDLGVSAIGMNIIFSSDIDSHSCKTLKLNQNKKPFLNNHPVICEDIRNLNSKIIVSALNGKNVDFVIGGPPCQAFSVFGKRKGLEDPRGDLVFEYARIIKETNPEAFLFENVAGIKTIHNGELYKKLLSELSIDGKYYVNYHEYELADFGVPQFRKRVFFIGTKNLKAIAPMLPTHCANDELFYQLAPFNTVSKALSSLPTPIIDWSDIACLNSHVGRKHSDRIIERYQNLKFGERDSRTRINKLHPNKPSYTIIVGSDAGGGKGHVHPYEPREVTPRESARIQTFPDWWSFSGTGRHVIRQVGNAVPPLFAAILAKYLAKEIFNVDVNLSFEQIIHTLELEYLL